jgi:hypothetical protein
LTGADLQPSADSAIADLNATYHRARSVDPEASFAAVQQFVREIAEMALALEQISFDEFDEFVVPISTATNGNPT